MRDAVVDHIAMLAELGLPVPEPADVVSVGVVDPPAA
jgi:hypothetical protein